MNNSADNWGLISSSYQQSQMLNVTKENKMIYLISSISLAMTTILSVLGVIGLSAYEKEIPAALIALGSVAVGALGSLFTHHK